MARPHQGILARERHDDDPQKTESRRMVRLRAELVAAVASEWLARLLCRCMFAWSAVELRSNAERSTTDSPVLSNLMGTFLPGN